jgi:lysozyme family protein
VIRQVNDERLAFLQRLPTWHRFGGGWGKRVASVKAISLNMAGTPAPETTVFGWSSPVENMFVRYVPLAAQHGPGKGN